jgi:asparagine synthetase B (glutamine-hydrolysing)
MGRRSLLKHKKEMTITSLIPVSSSSDSWEEVPVGGIFRYNWKTRETKFFEIPKSYFLLNRKQIHVYDYPVDSATDILRRAIHKRLVDLQVSSTGKALAVLFSGGVDSSVMTKLIDEALPYEFTIDLLNVAFQNENFINSCRKQKTISDDFQVPDRLTGIKAYDELKQMNPKRKFRFVCIDISMSQYIEARPNVIALIRPNDTVLDLSISIALWFAASGQGYVYDANDEIYKSTSKVVFVGAGIDEQLGGYSRHRSRWEKDGLDGVIDELELDLTRIHYRNLGRDDRCISDCGVEPRFPFLDEQLVQYLSNLPLSQKMDFSLPRGFGEKRLLRLIAKNLGFSDAVAFLPKRAIQFGSKTAKLEGGKRQQGDEKLGCMGKFVDDQ